jgi:hydrogenase nickel incorporation protein HypA/HybF
VHELSVCQALLTQVAEIAAGRGARAVERITIEMGPLCGVEPGLLASVFAVARAGGCAAAAALLIESTVVTVRCVTCGAQSQPEPNRLVCGACGGFRTQLVAGDELRLRRVELRMFEEGGKRVPCARPAAAASPP